MKTARMTLMFLACAAAFPALAQNTTDSRCGMTNYDRAKDQYTIVRPDSAPNQQCFITVVPKSQWQGGPNDPASSQFIEGNYQITLSGAAGGGGAGSTRGAGSGAQDADTSTVSRYLNPGVYRVTLGAGGVGGTSSGSAGTAGIGGAPTSLSNARTGETVAGFAGAETSTGTTAAPTGGSASGGRLASGTTSAGGEGGAKGDRNTASAGGAQGGAGFMKLALTDAVQPRAAAPQPQPAFVQAAAPAPMQAAAPAYVEAARAPAARPARRDRN